LVLVTAHYLKFKDHLLGAELTENIAHLSYKDQLPETVQGIYCEDQTKYINPVRG
jgi:hypothetical protein